MSSVTVLFTSHNRIEKTRECVYSLDDTGLDMRYFVVDDGCTDGTAEMLQRFAAEKQRKIEIIEGNGNLYWAGGMRAGMEALLAKEDRTDYLLMVNDDVVFEDRAVLRMIETERSDPGSCICGATCDQEGRRTHGGSVYEMGKVSRRRLYIDDPDLWCEVADMNAFLMPFEVFRKTGGFDPHYSHSMADYDYCFMLKGRGVSILMTPYYVGRCEGNDIDGTWRDVSLPRMERVRIKESSKGLPAREWFFFLKKNFGLKKAIWHSITPYLRILARL